MTTNWMNLLSVRSSVCALSNSIVHPGIGNGQSRCVHISATLAGQLNFLSEIYPIRVTTLRQIHYLVEYDLLRKHCNQSSHLGRVHVFLTLFRIAAQMCLYLHGVVYTYLLLCCRSVEQLLRCVCTYILLCCRSVDIIRNPFPGLLFGCSSRKNCSNLRETSS